MKSYNKMAEELFLIKPKQVAIREFYPELNLYQQYPFVYDQIPPQQLFAPEDFVLGHFIDMCNNVFVLSGTRYFTDNLGNLAKLKRGIDLGKLEIVRRVTTSLGQLDELRWKSERYIEYREKFIGCEAFQLRIVRNNKNDFINGLLGVLNEADTEV